MLSACNNDDSEPDDTQTPIIEPGISVVGTGTDDFQLVLSAASLTAIEGQGMFELPLQVSRSQGHSDAITLTASNNVSNRFLNGQFSDTVLNDGELNSRLQIVVSIGPKPIKEQTSTISITATDGAGRRSVAQLALTIQPTNSPDIYLLIGQSNMVGISEQNAKQSQIGEIDAPVNNIRQLNVTFNDLNNFSEASDFTNPEKLYNTGKPLTIALDPLHSGLQIGDVKDGTLIGMGLSFAKRAIRDTSQTIYLVPAAWSDTGFCKRDTTPLPDVGWNATPKDVPELSGTLLHDRTIARADAAIALTGGILRGILWHQGEADSDDQVCADSYAANLAELIRSLRANISADARGTSARGPDADIPFIVGTMSQSGDQLPFSASKLQVDEAHRNVASTASFTDFVNNDDLVPPAYPCGGGSCIHFGSAALREIGVRYYEKLISVIP